MGISSLLRQVDIQPQMLVTLPPGSEKGFAISPSGQIVGSVIYTDDTNRMSPLLTQKNNLMMSAACHAGSLQKVSFGPIYGTSRITDSKSPVCSIPLVAQFSTQTPLTQSSQSKDQNTYSVLIPSKSYDELLHCSGSKMGTLDRQQQQPLLGGHKNSKNRQDGYQTPLTLTSATTATNEHNQTTINYNTTVSFTPLQLTPTSSRSPSRTTDPCGGQASFV
ncbi:hypothetical protein ACTXT7_004325 [Hymenolepis weldensis]